MCRSLTFRLRRLIWISIGVGIARDRKHFNLIRIVMLRPWSNPYRTYEWQLPRSLFCQTLTRPLCASEWIAVESLSSRKQRWHTEQCRFEFVRFVLFVFGSNRTSNDSKKFCSRRTRTEQWSVRFVFVRNVRKNIMDKLHPQNVELSVTFELIIYSK